MSETEKEVRELSLINAKDAEYDEIMEEMHYHNTINAFVELIVLYGWDTVIGDLRAKMGEKQW